MHIAREIENFLYLRLLDLTSANVQVFSPYSQLVEDHHRDKAEAEARCHCLLGSKDASELLYGLEMVLGFWEVVVELRNFLMVDYRDDTRCFHDTISRPTIAVVLRPPLVDIHPTA